MAGYLIHHSFNKWDYIKKIKTNGYIYELKEKGVCFYLPCVESDAIQTLIARNEYYFEGDCLDIIRKKYIDEDAVVMDVGANIGNHTVYFVKECHAKKVYSFEPIPETFRILKKNVEINKIENVQLYNKAVGDITTHRASVKKRSNNGSGPTVLQADKEGEYEVITIDGLQIHETIDFIKIDVEGFEVCVLEGARGLLKRDHPTIFIEAFPGNYCEVKKILCSMGYQQKEDLGFDNYIFKAK